jgi:hypothetical protein
MIFDKNYDKALWLLVSLNKDDSSSIYNIISCISKDVYSNIQKAIDNYYNGKFIDIKDNVVYKATLVDKDCYDCAIFVKIVMGKLYFNIYRWKEDIERVEEEYQLILKDINDDDIDEMLYFDKKLIGNYSSEINNIKFVGYLTDVNISNYDRKYHICRVPFGYVIISSLGKKKIGRKFVNIKRDMPSEIGMEDLVVKKRKRIKK